MLLRGKSKYYLLCLLKWSTSLNSQGSKHLGRVGSYPSQDRASNGQQPGPLRFEGSPVRNWGPGEKLRWRKPKFVEHRSEGEFLKDQYLVGKPVPSTYSGCLDSWHEGRKANSQFWQLAELRLHTRPDELGDGMWLNLQKIGNKASSWGEMEKIKDYITYFIFYCSTVQALQCTWLVPFLAI